MWVKFTKLHNMNVITRSEVYFIVVDGCTDVFVTEGFAILCY